MEVVFVLGFGAVCSWFWMRNRRQQTAKEDVLHLAGTILGHNSTPDGRAWGDKLGVATELRFSTRGEGSATIRWTEIDVDLPRAYPLVLSVRKRALLDGRRVARGEAIDVELGDAEFDKAFRVEAAPADIAQRLVDAETRSFLAEHRASQLEDVEVGDRHVLRWATRRWIDAKELAPALDTLTRLARRVREVYAEVTSGPDGGTTGGPYRPERAASTESSERARREAEVAAAQALRTRRKLLAQGLPGILFGCFVLLTLVGIAVRVARVLWR